jgi:multiple antibiotic resistance protein
MDLDYLASAAVTLIVVVDPVGLAPAFLALTEGFSSEARTAVGRRASVIAFVILAGAAVGGDWLLRHLGISLPAFRIAGGLLLFAVAAEMVLGVRLERQSRTAEQAIEERIRNVAAVPLAIPLMAGPGAITAAVLLAGEAAQGALVPGAGSWPLRFAGLIGVIALVCLACLAVFAFAGRIGHVLGITGNVVLSRLLGVLLAALAVQYVIDGIRAVLG